jgi:hypothetical protein
MESTLQYQRKKKDQKKDDGAHKLGTKQKCFEANLRFVQR